jgi:Asp-tRNA(Asn)/Glu-tRNA(Gln) amidotransferase A subunit family amidase
VTDRAASDVAGERDGAEAPIEPPLWPSGESVEEIPVDRLRAMAATLGLSFSDDELTRIARATGRKASQLARLREIPLANDQAPAFRFDPVVPGVAAVGRPAEAAEVDLPGVDRPTDLDELAFASIPTLASLVRSRRVSCVELARLALERLRRLDPVLHFVVTYTEERALARAAALDGELAAGRWRGPLHGIPWGAKDLLAVNGYPTTWGTRPFVDQRFDEDATVVRRLDDAGAVLVAKLSLGELAWDDVWFGGQTRNPWDPAEGSSGSSAGSASAVAAGAVPFSIGSETLGSLVDPAAVCGCSALRPTFGRVSRHGAMALAWTMDKLGPVCRSAEDAAIVFAAIAGPDGLDETVSGGRAVVPAPIDPVGWRVGVVEAAFERDVATRPVLDELAAMGAVLVPVELPAFPYGALTITLDAEVAAAFDEFTLSGRLDEMERQDERSWPVEFRASRFIPAVEYLRANRIRRQLMVETDRLMGTVDLLVHPSRDDDVVMFSNLTGHPAVVAPWGARENGAPDSVTFMGRLHDDERLLAFVRAWQGRTGHHRRHPVL